MRSGFFLAFVLLWVTPSVQAGEPLTVALQRVESPPYQWLDKSGQWNGLVPDIYRQIFASLGYEIQFIAVDFFDVQQWDATIKRLQSGDIDFVGPALITPEAVPELLVSQVPFLNIQLGFFTLAERQINISDFPDLAQYKGVAVGAGMPEEAPSGLFNVIFTATTSEAEKYLTAGKVDYWLSPVYVANGYIYSHGLRGEIALSSLLIDRAYYLITANDEAARKLLQQAETLLKEMYESGKIQRLRSYHFTRYVRYSKKSDGQ